MALRLRHLCIFLILLAFFCMHVHAQEEIHGRQLCDTVFNFLAETELIPEAVPLIADGSNIFPYNITATFPHKTTTETKSVNERKTLILAFTLEDAYAHQDIISNFIKTVSITKTNPNIIFLFSYGDDFYDNESISGTEIFASNYDDTEDIAVVCISFSDDNKTSITPGGSGEIAPKWLTTYAANALNNSGIQFDIKGGIFISMYRIGKLVADNRTSSFFSHEIPAIGIAFGKNEDSIRVSLSLETFIKQYRTENTAEWERHYLLLKFRDDYILIGEKIIVITFIIIAFVAMGFLLFSSLIKLKRKKTFGYYIRILYALLLTLAISAIALQFSQPLVRLIENSFTISEYLSFAIKISISFVAIIFLFDFSSRFLGRLYETEYWSLIALIAIINFFMFSLTDISFFFIFGFELFIIYISRGVHRPLRLIFMFFLMALPFFLLAYQISQFAQKNVLSNIIYATPIYNTMIAMILYPFQLQWLRVIITMYGEQNKKNNVKKHFLRKQLFLLLVPVISFFAIIATASFITNSASLFQETAEREAIRYVTDDYPKITTSDRTFFGETFRTLEIDLGAEAFSCVITLEGKESMPVVYSENEFTGNTSNMTCQFITPTWPPSNLSFRYIAGNDDITIINVTAKYRNDNMTIIRTKEQTIISEKNRSDS